GAGFAVVADEVRNLAMRAADAARNTSNLIEGTVKRIGHGSDLVEKTSEEFTEVAKNAAKVGELVAEIAAASSEQAQGIEQLNSAVAEMDRIVQQNAANAEESASASEEMNAQAAQLNGVVEALVRLVGGSSGNGAGNRTQMKIPSGAKETRPKALPDAARGRKTLVPRQAREVGPEKVIPLEDAEFQDF
ncbi:MAG: methyl-accepting chemotaxis protein, partial [Deltaproteobacteria bacterium]|nr:methyl-accepting chemotaxis protein [Deltaproteobacteria bacterium]